jgi:hypothetical protein
MANIAGTGAHLAIDALDASGKTAVAVLGGAVDLAATAGRAPINVGEKAAAAVLAEVATLQTKIIADLRSVARAVTGA